MALPPDLLSVSFLMIVTKKAASRVFILQGRATGTKGRFYKREVFSSLPLRNQRKCEYSHVGHDMDGNGNH